MKSSSTNRRQFLGTAAGLGAVPYFAWSKPAFANQSSNDRPQVGCIGLGGMGSGDARSHASFGDIVAVCDVDEKHMLRAKNDERIGKGKADPELAAFRVDDDEEEGYGLDEFGQGGGSWDVDGQDDDY